jgi:iron(III) transport system permease protein
LLSAFVLCAGLSLAELTATVLTVPPGMETVILRLYNLMHYGDQRGVMMLALVQGLTVALGVCTAMILLGRRHVGD